MSKAATATIMEELHAAVAKKLKDRLGSDDCSGTDISNAIKFLKDSAIGVAPEDDSRMAELAAEIKAVRIDDGPDDTPHPFS